MKVLGPPLQMSISDQKSPLLPRKLAKKFLMLRQDSVRLVQIRHVYLGLSRPDDFDL